MSEAPSGAFSFFMLLCSETGDEFELRLLRYQFPQTLSGDDANWLIIKTYGCVDGKEIICF
jgi:hypothetical protein